MKNITDYFIKYFPDSIILPSLGNHEGVPINQFPSQDYWLYETIAQQWSKFKLNSTSYDTIKRHGYYTELLKPGFRVISINSNYCNDENWWILLSSGDPGHQHQWLVDTLTNAELNKERVILLGHIPPGENDQVEFCSEMFFKIINRFGNTVRAQFYGHTHWDQIKIFYQGNNPTNIAYVTPSVTTWVGVDPSFRIYEIDHWDNPNSSFSG